WWVVQAGGPGVAQQERAPRAAASGKHRESTQSVASPLFAACMDFFSSSFCARADKKSKDIRHLSHPCPAWCFFGKGAREIFKRSKRKYKVKDNSNNIKRW
ncbi:hypothetical protein PspLS_08345, partial [Pyricularia sp. CBS 133598]